MAHQISVRPRLIVTGASGFVGQQLLEQLRSRWRIFALDRVSRVQAGLARHPNVEWAQIDLADNKALARWFDEIRRGGGADALIHLAAYYDFSGEDHPEYHRTNVEGTRSVLDYSRGLGLKRFYFTSSLAASRFPPPGRAITEKTPPDGEHAYAVSKRLGEEMVAEYRPWFPSAIVRFPALFSDWCEYEPLFVFLETWLSRHWNARILGGKGLSAIPYMHVRDAVRGVRVALDKMLDLEPEEVLALSGDGAVSHLELYRAATSDFFGPSAPSPILMPKPLAAFGMWSRDLLGRVLGSRPFERPWMAEYIDQALTVDASHTRQRLGWQPRPRLHVLHRIPFMIENRKADPVEWNRRNARTVRLDAASPNLFIYRMMEEHEEEIITAFHGALLSDRAQHHIPHYQRVSTDDHEWNHRLILNNLMHSIRTKEKSMFTAYCRNLAERRFRQGFQAGELCYALTILEGCALKVLRPLAPNEDLADELERNVIATVRFGVDKVLETYEVLQGREDPSAGSLLQPSSLRAAEPSVPAAGGTSEALLDLDLDWVLDEPVRYRPKREGRPEKAAAGGSRSRREG